MTLTLDRQTGPAVEAVRKFLIFGLERSGTTSLAAVLNSAAPVVQEPFSSLSGDIGDNPAFRDMLEANGWLPDSIGELAEDDFSFNRFHFLGLCRRRCQYYLEQLYDRFTGVKHVWNPLSRQANLNILDWCFANDIGLVFHTRRSLGRSLLSRTLAQQADIHNLGGRLQYKSRWERARFEPIDAEQFEEQLGFLRENHTAYQNHLAGHPHHVLFYEDLFRSGRPTQLATLDALCGFLGCRRDDLSAETLDRWLFRKGRRQTSSDTLKRVPNLRQIEHLL